MCEGIPQLHMLWNLEWWKEEWEREHSGVGVEAKGKRNCNLPCSSGGGPQRSVVGLGAMTTELGDSGSGCRPPRRRRRVWSQEVWAAPTRRKSRGDLDQDLKAENASLRDFTHVLTLRVNLLETEMSKVQILVESLKTEMRSITTSSSCASERGSSAPSHPTTSAGS